MLHPIFIIRETHAISVDVWLLDPPEILGEHCSADVKEQVYVGLVFWFDCSYILVNISLLSVGKLFLAAILENVFPVSSTFFVHLFVKRALTNDHFTNQFYHRLPMAMPWGSWRLLTNNNSDCFTDSGFMLLPGNNSPCILRLLLAGFCFTSKFPSHSLLSVTERTQLSQPFHIWRPFRQDRQETIIQCGHHCN